MAYIALLFSFSLYGQRSIIDDTVVIKEVVISRKLNSSVLPGYKKYDTELGHF